MKSALVIAAALALCGSAFATDSYHAQKHNGVIGTVKQDAHQIGSAFRHDAHTIARAPKFREQEGMDHHATQTHAMGAGRADTHMYSSRQERMDEAYANWERSHRR
ncbi:hypothetical protein JJB11_13255 [Ramlibacter ginsenosidimutans]|uniref:DUF4148 domain-containing protein n=1 Tax=Ramlibacter ginsenosidimutans TaxID=502333 RepID=A0A934TTF4_9BURK|nr:hypothetical protein [Ramlibacter ginsenosidimutans]MBK6007063.1 hypothetical protein [Ramlibacter ginsenosidimutans]